MVVAKKRLSASTLIVPAGKPALPEKKPALPTQKTVLQKSTPKTVEPGPDPMPFTQWTMPVQEEKYIKCRDHDFL